MEAKIYNTEGKEMGAIKLPESVFGLFPNADLLHQVVVSMQSNARVPVAHTHDRGEQRGGGRKPWRQKGTGRARHGSRRSPLWRGGGVTFGPRNEKNFEKKITNKTRARALGIALSGKLLDQEILFVERLTFSEPKTHDAKALLTSLSRVPGFEALASKKKNAALVVLPEQDAVAGKSFSNMGNVSVTTALHLNALDILSFKHVLVADPERALQILEKRVRSVRATAGEQEPTSKKAAVAAVA
jgi:large subunit ribosomal protein L4